MKKQKTVIDAEKAKESLVELMTSYKEDIKFNEMCEDEDCCSSEEIELDNPSTYKPVDANVANPNSGTYAPPKNEYPYTLKEFTGGPVLKADGKPFKWGTIIPLIGGCSLGCAKATNKKPDFMVTYSGFMGNEKSLIDYWPDVPYFNLNEFDVPEYANNETSEEKKSLELLKEYFKEVDFVNAVPPCAGLSSLNASKGKSAMSRGADAVQNEWMYKSTRFVLTHIKPKVLWGENAPALFTKTGQGVADKLAETAKEFGYSFSLMKTNSMFHGVPQKRERTFYFFWQSESAPILNYVSKERPSLIEFLRKIPDDAYRNENIEWTEPVYPSYDWILEKEGKTHAEWVKEHEHSTLHGYFAWNNMIDEVVDVIKKNYTNGEWEIKNLMHIKNKLANGKGWWDNSPHFFYDHFNAVVGRNMFRGMHPEYKRFLNLRELIWLMGHPHDFNMFENEKGNAAVPQISQNVPVITASHWAEEVMKFVNGELAPSGEIYFRQNNKYGQKPQTENVSKSLF